MESNNNFNTFWDLINTHRIEIPIIQRDYAQGRTDAKATQIREGFIKSLIDSLKTQIPLHLDFVYGKVGGKTDMVKIENNKKAIASLLKSVQSYSDNLDISFTYQINEQLNINEETKHTFFIPLDGQQRLTTLYLLHWYLISRLNLQKENSLKNFSYRTRRSSKDFCKALISNVFEIKLEKTITAQITDISWFFSNWKKDPTVRSMLTVLDEIHLNLSSHSNEVLLKLWKNLTEDNLVTFEFLDLDKFELTDELYVKMNARGKHLTDFENFKAWLQEYVKKNNIDVSVSDWQTKMDIKWTDIFWYFKDSKNYEIDKEYLTFFNLMSLYFITENISIENNKIEDESREIIDKFRNSEYISQSTYDKKECFKKENIDKIFLVLNSLEDNGFIALEEKIISLYSLEEISIFKKFFGSENSSINLPDRTFIYAIIKFLILKEKNVNDYNEIDDLHLFRWIRVCKNLIYNVYVFNPETFVNAIKSINTLSDNCFNIYEYLINKGSDISFFTSHQKNDEVLKSKLILNDLSWEENIVEFERHSYFYGQIDFILEISKEENETYSKDIFVNYAKKSAAIFDSKILNNKDFLFHRAFLSKKNYFLSVSENSNFCSNNNALRDKEENWRRVLRNPEKLAIYKSLLDELEVGKEIEGLNKIINNYESDSWKKYFVKSPEPFKCCDSYLIRKYNEDNILLFKTSRLYGQHAELRTYSFYCNHLKNKKDNFSPFKNLDYWFNPRNENYPCIFLYDFKYKNKLYKMDIFFIADNKIFELDFYSQNNKKIDVSLQTHLENFGFNFIDNHLYLYTDSNDENKLLNKINKLNKSLLSL